MTTWWSRDPVSGCSVGSEEGPQVGDHVLGHFERGEVPTGGVSGPVVDVRVVALGQRPDGLEVVLEDRDPDPALLTIGSAPACCSS